MSFFSRTGEPIGFAGLRFEDLLAIAYCPIYIKAGIAAILGIR